MLTNTFSSCFNDCMTNTQLNHKKTESCLIMYRLVIDNTTPNSYLYPKRRQTPLSLWEKQRNLCSLLQARQESVLLICPSAL